ncbi:MAG: TIM barrel protein [Candidatus Nanopelagicales bacterium]
MTEAAFSLAVCAEMVFTELPVIERIRRIHDLGFDVEIWDFNNKDLSALAATGATFQSMSGYTTGNLLEGADELLRTSQLAIDASRVLGSPRLNHHGTGLGVGGLPVSPTPVVTGAMWLQAAHTLERLAELGEREDVVFCLENLNLAVDHPGVPFARAEDTITLVSAVDNPHLRLNLDLYHAQIGEGNLIELVERALPWIGEIQVADVPGRCEPGTGEINYANIAAALRRLGYTGTVAMEAYASAGSELALARFREQFTAP